ncbi:MAG: 30S ribosome-binding factor RbfA [Candidatus Melainabacteria bacterium]|nr:30S ribosome-binding factor RbfA [Candidatus Melainabacteria bacterium]
MGSQSEFSRVDRVRKAILKEMGDILAREIKDPRLESYVISVTEVVLTNDLRHAKVYVSILHDDPDQRNLLMTILMEYQSKIRSAIGRRIRLRYTPEVELALDTSLERGMRVSQLLEKISRGEV